MESNSTNFIEQIINKDLSEGFNKKNLCFRFPPEPNGYLHIGHAKAIAINFGLGEKYGAPVNLRFDDTNPSKEEQEYVDAIIKDVSWLKYSWEKITYSSDHFQTLYLWAEMLIVEGKAYIDSQTSEEIAIQKGTPTAPGTNSPHRDRASEESLQIFREMKEGKHEEGSHVLRAKIDMSDPNMLLRDPVMYRVLHKPHHRTGDSWCIYPMYDWAHGQSDYCEQVSHSLCSLEFKPHRKLYEWFTENLKKQKIKNLNLLPKQREFARLNLTYTIMSKRKLVSLVEKGHVSGWDDPRMPTISGLRRRGYTPESIRSFVEKAGVAKRENLIDVSLLEFCIRDHLNKTVDRKMVVVNPIKITITNYPAGKEESLVSENNPEQENSGTRELPFSKHLYIEKEDFREQAGRKFFRLTLDKEVRLKSAYIIKGESVVKNGAGEITEVLCTYDPKSKSGSGSEESLRKVKGTLHWVSQKHAVPVEIREYDRLFMTEVPGEKEGDFLKDINPQSLNTAKGYAEPSLAQTSPGSKYQFQRKGYFVADDESTEENIVFNKTVALRDNWKKK
ncbi:MAG TPA: glutamine--tRNA ligase/YqeY domain fusion protein [Flavobacteriaceae bacterium]|nr:glutamine--tRNA ligase/YqeY domain fusion protein [Flavobacteriaceae bacterium]